MRDPKGPVKPYRSPQEISKRSHVPLNKIMKQVKIGTKVEGEHTTSKSGARITALQHVDELPDYYTKLKKVEKKPAMKESLETAKMGLEGQRYCKLCRKSETQSECKFGPDMWNRFSIATVHPANMPEEFLGEKKGLWDNIHARRKKGLPPKKPGEKGYPKTLDVNEDHKEIASGKKKDEEGYMANVEFDQIERAVNILRKKITKGDQQIPAWVQSKITRAADFIDTAADYISSEETVSEEQRPFPFKKVATQQEKARKASVYGKDTGNEPAPQVSDAQKKATKRFSRMHQVSSAARRAQQEKQKAGRSSTFFKDTHPTSAPRMKKSRVNEELSEDLKQARKNVGASKCWPGKVAKGTKMKGGREVPNCVPANEDTCITFVQFMQLAEVAAWQRKEGKNPSGGLNEKGRKSYERENPGSDLKAPQPEGGPRKRSFCARMGGMPGPMKDEKGRPTRKALALRKWKC